MCQKWVVYWWTCCIFVVYCCSTWHLHWCYWILLCESVSLFKILSCYYVWTLYWCYSFEKLYFLSFILHDYHSLVHWILSENLCFSSKTSEIMMTSSNDNIFRVTGPLWGESTGGFLLQRPVTRSFDVFFDLRQNKRLSKLSWFESPSRSIWRHCDLLLAMEMYLKLASFCYLPCNNAVMCQTRTDPVLFVSGQYWLVFWLITAYIGSSKLFYRLGARFVRSVVAFFAN